MPAERSFAELRPRGWPTTSAPTTGRRSASIVAEVEQRLAACLAARATATSGARTSSWIDGKLDTVLDWEWAARDALPLIDLFDLIALSRRRVKDLTPGERFTEVLWPLVRAGGDERVQRVLPQGSVCRPTSSTLEALAVAYWLNRVARQLHPLAVFLQREGWAQRNLHGPIRGSWQRDGEPAASRCPREREAGRRGEAPDRAGGGHGGPAERSAADDHRLDPRVAVGEAALVGVAPAQEAVLASCRPRRRSGSSGRAARSPRTARPRPGRVPTGRSTRSPRSAGRTRRRPGSRPPRRSRAAASRARARWPRTRGGRPRARARRPPTRPASARRGAAASVPMSSLQPLAVAEPEGELVALGQLALAAPHLVAEVLALRGEELVPALARDGQGRAGLGEQHGGPGESRQPSAR